MSTYSKAVYLFTAPLSSYFLAHLMRRTNGPAVVETLLCACVVARVRVKYVPR